MLCETLCFLCETVKELFRKVTQSKFGVAQRTVGITLYSSGFIHSA